jgi:phosphatidylinositol-3-phosphatase
LGLISEEELIVGRKVTIVLFWITVTGVSMLSNPIQTSMAATGSVLSTHDSTLVKPDSVSSQCYRVFLPMLLSPQGVGIQSTIGPQGAVVPCTNVPAFSHVYLLVMENQYYGNIVGNSSAPYINSLIANYGLATNYQAVAHPSEPNYLALFSGSTQGVTDDVNHDFSGPNLADQLEAKGKTWRVFAENYPVNLGCYTGATYSGGEDGGTAADSWTYARKHEPAVSFTDISTSTIRCGNISDFTHFDPSAADFELIVPNLLHDMHDQPSGTNRIATGDAFLHGFVTTILSSTAWSPNSVLFIVWDEAGANPANSNQVVALVITSSMPKGFQSNIAHDHYALLRTIEDAWGLGCLNNTCTANNFDEFFH